MWASLSAQYDAIDSTILEHVMAPHSSGVQLLLAPTNPDHADEIDTTRMIGILEGVRGESITSSSIRATPSRTARWR